MRYMLDTNICIYIIKNKIVLVIIYVKNENKAKGYSLIFSLYVDFSNQICCKIW